MSYCFEPCEGTPLTSCSTTLKSQEVLSHDPQMNVTLPKFHIEK